MVGKMVWMDGCMEKGIGMASGSCFEKTVYFVL